MKVLCTIVLEFENAEKAKKVLRSIEADDQGFVKSKVTGKKLEAIVEGSSVSSLLHTLDDYLSCVSVAAEIVKK